jgi:hypothetical protein
MGETSTGLSPGEVRKNKKVSKGDLYRELSDKAMNYNLRDDLVGEMAMKHLSAVAKSINRANRKAAVKKR